jgi:hypothetical protein
MATATVATQLPSADDEYVAARREWRDRYPRDQNQRRRRISATA